jgi:hypothetical protein
MTDYPDNKRENSKLKDDYPAIRTILCLTEPFNNRSRHDESR